VELVHGVPDATGGFPGVPEVHTSFVQGLPSAGTSVLSMTLVTPPAPSQTLFRQSPGVCAAEVPAGALVNPQVLGADAPHTRVRHAVSVPAQSEATTQATQAPAPSHTLPPFALHAVIPLAA
jgi:hypothetical protein